MTTQKIRDTKLALGALAVLIAGSTTTYAQEGSSFPDYTFYVGRDSGMGPKCPPMQYHIVPKNKTQLEGVAYTMGQDGMELYAVTGGLSPDGKVSLALKPVGVGKPATVEGTYKMGMLMVKTTSGSCHVDDFMMMPVVPPARAPQAGDK